MRLLDLFCGRWGWSRAFSARGWECFGVDLVANDAPERCTHWRCDVMHITPKLIKELGVDFIVASSPCEQFSVHGQRHFHPNPPWPALGIELFTYTQSLCEATGLPYVMENVRSAQRFIGTAVHHCGPYYLWGNAVPPIMPQGIQKGTTKIQGALNKQERLLPPAEKYALRMRKFSEDGLSYTMSKNKRAALTATIPPELANCVADYAERILEQRAVSAAHS